MPEHLIFQSVARRLDAGTYLPRQRTTEIQAATHRPMREYAAEILVCASFGGLIGFLLGGGLS